MISVLKDMLVAFLILVFVVATLPFNFLGALFGNMQDRGMDHIHGMLHKTGTCPILGCNFCNINRKAYSDEHDIDVRDLEVD